MRQSVIGLVFSVLFVVAGAPALAGEPVEYTLTDTSSVSFEASTPLFAFTGQSDAVTGTLAITRNPLGVEGGTELSVPVQSLKTGIQGRDHDLYELMQVDTYPAITFRPDTVNRDPFQPGELTPSGVKETEAADTETAVVTGSFSIRGVSRSVGVPVVASFGENSLRIRSTFTLDMRDFGIDPPSLYVMSVNPTVTVSVDLRAVRSEDAQGSIAFVP